VKTGRKPRADRLFRLFIEQNRKQIRKNKVLFAVHLVIRLMVIAVLITELVDQSYYNVFFCVLTLVLLMIPSFVERKIKIDVPDVLEIIILLFIFAAQILGELREYYLAFPYWDTMLHTVNGFLCGAIGLALIDILNKNEKFSIRLSPVYVALFAFAFSMTVGVLWEFFEFGMDRIFRTDMQKDTVISSISSVLLHPEGRNIPVLLEIDSVAVNGELWDYGGYIDIGLLDTMKDLFVNFIGAAVFSLIGYFYVRSEGRGRLLKQFILTKMNDNPGSKK
jgi:hypothetical protein